MSDRDFRFKPNDVVRLGDEVFLVLWREIDRDECTPTLERGWYVVREKSNGKSYRVRDWWLHRGQTAT